MEVNVYNIKGEDTGRKITLNESIFGIEPNDHAIYLDVKQFMANQRQGTHKSKERSEISGSTRKLGRQKGGGGARRGDINSPVLVGGGRVFGPKPRDYYFKLNKKVKALARKSALAYKAQNNAIIVVEDFNFEGRENEEGLSMPGSPAHTANASLYFEKAGLNIRLSYNFASEFIDEMGESAFYDRYYDKVNYMDANASYTFGKKIKTTFYAEANNLLNQPLRYYQGTKDRTMQACLLYTSDAADD